MKKLTNTHILIGLFGAVFLANRGNAEVQSKIDNFELSSCSQKIKKCISVSAQKAQSGSISANLALKNIKVEVKNEKNKILKSFSSENGFYDLETNRIILSQLVNGDTLKETVIYMQDLEIKHMEMR